MSRGLRRLDRKIVAGGSIIDFCADTMQLPDGVIQTWDFVYHRKGGGAAIVPVLPDGRILMIRQFRPAIDRETLEIPAGALDVCSEGTMETASRELREETGYSCKSLIKLARIRGAVAYCNEYTDIYAAEGLTLAGEQELDEAEEIRTEAYEPDALIDMILDGTIEDAKTAAGILAWEAYRRRQSRKE